MISNTSWRIGYVPLFVVSLSAIAIASGTPAGIGGTAPPRVPGQALPIHPEWDGKGHWWQSPDEVRASEAAQPTSAKGEFNFEARIDRDRLFFDEPGDGAVWVRGADYKASFSESGATYVPDFGSKAPRSCPLAFRLQSVTRGAESLAFDHEARARREASTVRFERGIVTETYQLALRAMEQSFTFERLPGGGDLTVRIALEGDFGVSVDGRGFRFTNELGSVAYGAAEAYDASGRRLALESHFVAGVIEITVPAAFADSARLPLTIDPVVTNLAVEMSAFDCQEPDVAYDVTNNVYLVCYEEEFSGTDHDIWAQFHDGTTGALIAGSGEYIEYTTAYWASPRAGNVNAGDKFLVVAQVGNPAGVRQIWGRLRDANSTTMTATLPISNPGETWDMFHCDVGSDPYPTAPSYFCVVWEGRFTPGSDHDIQYRLVGPDGTLVGPFAPNLDNAGVLLNESPRISRGNDGTQWQIAWSRRIAPGNRDVYAARIQWDGTVTAPAAALIATGSDEFEPCPSTQRPGTSVYVVAYTQPTSSLDVWGAVVDGMTIQSQLNFNGSFFFENEGSIDYDGHEFLVANTASSNGAANNHEIDARTVVLYGAPPTLKVVSASEDIASGGMEERPARLCSSFSSGAVAGALGRAVIVFTSDTDARGVIYQANYDYSYFPFCDGSGFPTACPCGNNGSPLQGCGNSVNPSGAELVASGASLLAADTLVLSASGMPPNTACLYFQGSSQAVGAMGPGTVFGDGIRCAAGSVIRLGIKTNNALGASAYPTGADPLISVRGMVTVQNTKRYYQTWYRNAAAFCTASTFNLSNGMEVTWF